MTDSVVSTIGGKLLTEKLYPFLGNIGKKGKELKDDTDFNLKLKRRTSSDSYHVINTLVFGFVLAQGFYMD